MKPAKRQLAGRKVRAALQALQVREDIHGIVWHEDEDGRGIAETRTAAEMELGSLPACLLLATPSPNLEAWWFQFPRALTSTCSRWVLPSALQTGQLDGRAGKLELQRLSRGTGREYDERRDSPVLAETACLTGEASDGALHRAETYRIFVDSVQACCVGSCR